MPKGTDAKAKPSSFGGSLAVAAGIFTSRLAGLLRQSVFAWYFGNSAAADVFNAAFRIPNLLQNLFGEGALSASFIPVYARLNAEGRGEEAKRVAWAVASALALLTSLLVLAGVLATPLLIDLIAPGFTGEKREATIRLVQIFFPGAGLLVLSAWCLGVLNSHRAFFLSYVAPVVWSAAIVAALLIAGRENEGYRLAEWAAWGSVAGSLLQFAVQLPFVLRYVGKARLGANIRCDHTREVLKNFMPVALSRGVVQISAYVDQIIASFLPTGAVAALAYAQVIYTLPVSLFGMAVSASELPEMSSQTGTGDEIAEKLRGRLQASLARIAFFVVPSVAALALLGDAVAGLLFERGNFTRADSIYVWTVLAASSVGLLAATFGRLYASAFFALRDTATPLRFAVARVAAATALGYLLAIVLPPMLGLSPSLSTAGLALGSALAGWIEYLLLRRGLEARIGRTGARRGVLLPVWLSALAGAGAGWAVKLALATAKVPHFIGYSSVVVTFGAAYFGCARALKVEEAAQVLEKVRRILFRR